MVNRTSITAALIMFALVGAVAAAPPETSATSFSYALYYFKQTDNDLPDMRIAFFPDKALVKSWGLTGACKNDGIVDADLDLPPILLGN